MPPTNPSPHVPQGALKLCGAVALWALALFSTACGDAAPAMDSGERLSGSLQLTGSSTIAPLAAEIGKRFEAQHPGTRIEIQTGGSSRGIADTGKGLADIGMSSRALKTSEEAGRRTWALAMDGVGFIVHAENPVAELSREQLTAIFAGQINDWSEVGGTAGEIIVINRAEGRSELELVTEFFGLAKPQIAADLIAGENQQGIKMVANDRRAITYMSVGASEYEAAHGTSIKLLPLDGIAASVANVAAERFPLSRPLILVTTAEPSPLARTFIDFARSSQVHDLVKDLSYVPLTASLETASELSSHVNDASTTHAGAAP